MRQLLLYHMLAFFAGFVLDLIFGDPQGFPHPVRWIGTGIARLTDRYLKKAGRATERTKNDEAYIRQRKRRYGLYMVIEVVLLTGLVSAAVLIFCWYVHPILGCAMEAFMTYQMLAAKSLRTESMRVYTALRNGTLEDARHG